MFEVDEGEFVRTGHISVDKSAKIRPFLVESKSKVSGSLIRDSENRMRQRSPIRRSATVINKLE